MNRLIRAEWYRVRNSYHMLRWTILFCLFISGISYIDLLTGNVDFDGIGAFNSNMEMAVVILCYLPMFVGGMYVASYENKTLNYEVMTGNSINKIILSKLITCVPLMSVLIMAVCASAYFVFGVKNGYGDNKGIGLKILIIGFIAFKIVTCAILIMTTFKSTIGLFVIFVRFMVVEAMGAMLIEMVLASTDKAADAVEKWDALFVQGACSTITSPKLQGQSIKLIIILGLIEMAFWYVLSYSSYKKKWFN